jgi:hypothetical protein
MNYKPAVSWGVFGATSSSERTSFFASWGLLASAPEAPVGVVSNLLRRYGVSYRSIFYGKNVLRR